MNQKELKKFLKKFKNNTAGLMFWLSKEGERVYKAEKTDYEGKYVTAQEFIYKLAGTEGDLYVLVIKSLNGPVIESILVGVYDSMPCISTTVFCPLLAFKRDKETFMLPI